MSRATFDIPEVFVNWLKNRKRDYEVYYDSETVYALPTVSTRPVVYGILETTDTREVVETVRPVVGSENVYPIRTLTYDETSTEAAGPLEDDH